MFLIFLKYVKIVFVGLKLDRPQLQNWLLFSEHNWPTPKSENSSVVGLPVLMGYDCVCASACRPPVLLISGDAGSSSSLVESESSRLQLLQI